MRYSHKYWPVPKREVRKAWPGGTQSEINEQRPPGPINAGQFLRMIIQDGMVYDCWFRDRIHNSWSVRKKNMFLFHLLLGKTGSWNYGTSLSRILDLELSPSFFAWYHIMVRYWFVVSQLIIFKNSAHNGNFAHHQSVWIYLESIQKSLGIYSTFIHWRQILYLDI